MNDGGVPAVVLAAGAGQRLSPLTNQRPKPMLPVANRPLLEYVLGAIIDAGIDEVVFVVGYRQHRIRNHFGDGDDWGVSITYVEQSNQLGTGHAILQVEDVVDGEFLVLNGDRILEPSLIERVRAQADTPALAITGANFPSTFGVVEMTGDRLARIEEKPVDPSPTAQINAGVYLFDESIFGAIQETPTVDGEIPITATLSRLKKEVQLVRYDGTWLDVTYLWDLLPVNANRISATGEHADDVAERMGSSVAPDVALDKGIQIGTNATVSGGCAVGENVRIGPNAVLENAVVLPDATIDAGAVVRDVVVGANASIGANVTIGGGTGSVTIEGIAHEDVTLGGVIGDNADVGSGTVLAPGTVIGDGATIETGARLDGRIPPDATVRRG